MLNSSFSSVADPDAEGFDDFVTAADDPYASSADSPYGVSVPSLAQRGAAAGPVGSALRGFLSSTAGKVVIAGGVAWLLYRLLKKS